ncbi:MAG: methyltransferase [Oscillatoriaceae cyanobacterium Prado104]|jgi:hypothetical protein|nr:methyltransferase [Oscillatoriaceae cyanobacterium Prado104]
MLTSSYPLKQVFHCPEESDFYAHSLESLVLNTSDSSRSIVEFGSGEGSPVIKALLRTSYEGKIEGFELNNVAWKIAKAQINEFGLSENYIVRNSSFFDSPAYKQADCLISNPPYLPAADNNIYQPLLHGGTDGSGIAKQLLSLGCEKVLLMVSSYSHPVGLINYACDRGYAVANFEIAPLTFGYYSSEPKVKNAIGLLRKQGMAFYSQSIYLLAGVLFKKQEKSQRDLSGELMQLMTAL